MTASRVWAFDAVTYSAAHVLLTPPQLPPNPLRRPTHCAALPIQRYNLMLKSPTNGTVRLCLTMKPESEPYLDTCASNSTFQRVNLSPGDGVANTDFGAPVGWIERVVLGDRARGEDQYGCLRMPQTPEAGSRAFNRAVTWQGWCGTLLEQIYVEQMSVDMAGACACVRVLLCFVCATTLCACV